MSAEQEHNLPPAIVEPENKIRSTVTLGGRIEVTGDGFEPNLLKQAEAAAEGTRDVFLEAAVEDLGKLHANCELAEKEAANRGKHLKAVQNAAHEIKGYGRNIGFDLLTNFGHSLSGFLITTKADESRQVKVARVHVDAMRLVFLSKMTGDGGEAGMALAKGLNEAVAKVS